MSVCVCGCTQVCMYVKRLEEDIRIRDAIITGGCGLPHVGSANCTQVLWKSSELS